MCVCVHVCACIGVCVLSTFESIFYMIKFMLASLVSTSVKLIISSRKASFFIFFYVSFIEGPNLSKYF